MQKDLEQHYQSIRARNRSEQLCRRAECERRSAAFLTYADARAKAVMDVACGRCTPKESNIVIDRIRAAERAELVRLQLPETYLDPIYDCPICHDSGYTGEDLYLPCRCMLQQRQTMLCAASRVNDRETFERFREDIFLDATERKQHMNAKKLCERFAEQPAGASPFTLVLTGTAGTGKSFLGNAIAYRVITQGTDARFLTAYQLIQNTLNALSVHTDALEEFISAPLLVLDDLGVEPMIPNITVETVFTLLNERTVRQLRTVILTNLSLSELQGVYGERIASRIYDQSHTRILPLSGTNLRRSKL